MLCNMPHARKALIARAPTTASRISQNRGFFFTMPMLRMIRQRNEWSDLPGQHQVEQLADAGRTARR